MVHIEKISLRGFKSFGNQRMGIPLSKGFTAIVGPNGSGKSNVVDAICFVLGRMSTKSMRAEKFSDLIWVGNEKYPPGSYAEVSLHLNNADRKLPLDEAKVIVSRRVDRSGRSVYRANKRRVTRNEVVDLLAIAGIFPEGYNIVLQGDVTRLIKMTPLERRLLIDELSGIAEYDMKKERAMRELTKAEENIRATNLVIDEVLSGLRRLERERDEAVRYQDLITQVRELRWQFQSNQLRQFRERYRAILEKTDQGSARIEEIESEIRGINAEIERRQDRQDELERTIEKRLEIDQERVGKQMEEVRAQIVRAQENLKNTQENRDREAREAQRLESEISDVDSRVTENRNKIKVLEGQSKNVVESLEALRSKQGALQEEIARLEEANAKLRDELSAVDSGLRQARLAEAGARRRSSEARVALARENEELSYLRKTRETEETRLGALVERKTRAEAELQDLEKGLNTLGNDAGELGRDMDKYARTLAEVTRDLEEGVSQVTSMEARLRVLDESQSPVRKAIADLAERQNRGEIGGILGTLSELTKVADRYGIPVSAATGPLSDCVVVEDREVAMRCMELLKKHQVGWASFIPVRDLERMNDRPGAEILRMKGVLGLAAGLVEFEEKLRPVFEFALGRTIVTDSLASSKALPRKFRTVTLDGEVMEPSGMISGGHYDPMQSGFGPLMGFTQEDLEAKRREVESLRKEKKGLEVELDRLRSDVMSAEKRRSELGAQVEAKKRQIEQIELEMSEIEEESKGNLALIADVGGKLSSLESEAGESEEEAKRAAGALAEVERKRDELVSRIESPELKRHYAEYREVSAGINAKVSTESKLNSDAKALQREIEILEQNRARMVDGLGKSKQGVAGLDVVLEKIRKDVPKLEKELSQLSSSRQDIADEIKQLRTSMNTEKHDLYELVQRRNTLDQDKNRLSVEINSSVYERSQLDIQIHNLENELSLVDYEYEPVELDNLEEISKRISALEAERSRLEPVNMRAIEAYEEQEEKFNYYKERRDKVMEEREAILQFMAEIETKKKEVFMEAFNSISQNFSGIFSKLSPGGVGKLLLEDYEDPFAGGLEIEAKPAGKEVAGIDSMSGGEKALTALAFIFAVQAYKPSPFYILDEIDAHLDDDNVKRVAELVAETSRGSQFVVVTLRDSMMAQANELIGVSMEESGISKCVGVRMEAGRLVEDGGGTTEEAQAGGAEA